MIRWFWRHLGIQCLEGFLWGKKKRKRSHLSVFHKVHQGEELDILPVKQWSKCQRKTNPLWMQFIINFARCCIATVVALLSCKILSPSFVNCCVVFKLKRIWLYSLTSTCHSPERFFPVVLFLVWTCAYTVYTTGLKNWSILDLCIIVN